MNNQHDANQAMDSESTNASIWNELRLAYYLLTDPDTPLYIKAMPLLAVIYLFLPEGWIVWPLATPIDDVALFYVALKGMTNLAPPRILEKYRKKLGMDVVEGEFEVVEDEPDMADKELDASIILNPDRRD